MALLPDLSFDEFEAEKVRLRFNEDIVNCIAAYLRKKKRVTDPRVAEMAATIVLGQLNPNSFRDMQRNEQGSSPDTHSRRALAERYKLRLPDGAEQKVRHLADSLARMQLSRTPSLPGPNGKPLLHKQLKRRITTQMLAALRAEMIEFRTYVI